MHIMTEQGWKPIIVNCQPMPPQPTLLEEMGLPPADHKAWDIHSRMTSTAIKQYIAGEISEERLKDATQSLRHHNWRGW